MGETIRFPGRHAPELAHRYSRVVGQRFQYGKQWKNYRSTEQFLRQEAIYFKHRTGFYAKLDEANSFRIFVERVENAIAPENAVTLDTPTRESNVGRQGAKEE